MGRAAWASTLAEKGRDLFNMRLGFVAENLSNTGPGCCPLAQAALCGDGAAGCSSVALARKGATRLRDFGSN